MTVRFALGQAKPRRTQHVIRLRRCSRSGRSLPGPAAISPLPFRQNLGGMDARLGTLIPRM